MMGTMMSLGRYGVYDAVVHNNADPLNTQRVVLKIPQVLGTSLSNWAPPLANATGNPPVNGLAVYAMFIGGDVNYPVYIIKTEVISSTPTGTPILPSGDTTGVTDTAAIQAAINDGIEQITLGPGEFYIAGVNPANNTHIMGVGIGLTTVNSSQTTIANMFDFQNSFIINFEIDHMTITTGNAVNPAASCGGDIFTNLNLHRSFFHHLELKEYTGIYHVATFGSSGTGLSATTFEDIEQYIYCNTALAARSVPAWLLYETTGSGKNIDVVNFSRIRSINEADILTGTHLDNTQFIFDIGCAINGTGGLIDRISFINCDFGETLGGAIRLLSVQGILIEQISVGNIFNQLGVTLGNSVIYIGRYSVGAITAAPSMSPIITGYVRESSGTITFGTFSEIEIDANSTGATIVAPLETGASSNPGVKINLNGSAGAAILNAQSNVNVLNQAGDTRILGSGTDTLGKMSMVPESAPVNNLVQAATFDPSLITSTGLSPVNGTIYMQGFNVYQPITITSIGWNVITHGTGPVAGESWVGVVNSSGTILSSVNIDSLVTSTGNPRGTITSTLLVPGFYYFALLFNASGLPVIGAAGCLIGAYNVGTSTSNLRGAVNGTTQTAFPGSFTLSSNVSTAALPFFVFAE